MRERRASALRRRGELCVLGLGPRGLKHLTLESLEALRSLDEVYSTAFQEALGPFCAELGVRHQPLDWGGRRAQPSDRTRPGQDSVGPIEEAVLAALGRGRRVGLVVEGHPSLFSFARGLRAKAEAAGHACRLLASVHPLDQILAVLEPRMGRGLDCGLALHSALAGPALESVIDPRLALFVYNLGHLRRAFPRSFSRLAARLRRAYGASHRAFFVECAPEGDHVRECQLRGLEGGLRRVGVNATLCIPARARMGR